MTQLLLLSNSTIPGEPFFSWALPQVADFLPEKNGYVAFVPYAAVGFSYDEYEAKLQQAWSEIGLKVKSVHLATDKQKLIEEASALAVGGGNTFALLNKVIDEDLVNHMRNSVSKGLPFIGWSAGANLACPTIKTTNDMPIVQPLSFEALNLVPFQINPHYTELKIPGHGGEGRIDRLKEFLAINQHMRVVGLPEAALLHREGEKLTLKGKAEAVVLSYNQEPEYFSSGSDMSFLL